MAPEEEPQQYEPQPQSPKPLTIEIPDPHQEPHGEEDDPDIVTLSSPPIQDHHFTISHRAQKRKRMVHKDVIALEELGPGQSLLDSSAGVQLHDHTVIGGKANKREIDDENVISNHSLFSGNGKRLRSDSQLWDNSSDFDLCMDQMQHLMGEARMMNEAKEQAYTESSMNQQIFFLNELKQRNNLIEQLLGEKQKKQEQVKRLDRELSMMENVLQSYRKAMKETQRQFDEYRAHYPAPQLDEPLYKDVAGSKGLVMSTRELEKQEKQEEERMMKMKMKCLMIERKVKEFEAGWISSLEAHHQRLHLLGNRLLNVKNEEILLKKFLEKRKVSECAPNEQ